MNKETYYHHLAKLAEHVTHMPQSDTDVGAYIAMQMFTTEELVKTGNERLVGRDWESAQIIANGLFAFFLFGMGILRRTWQMYEDHLRIVSNFITIAWQPFQKRFVTLEQFPLSFTN